MIIVYMMGFLTTMSALAAFLYIHFIRKKHDGRLNIQRERFSKQQHSQDEKDGFEYLLIRESNYIRNYITFQIVGKICEMMSITLSVAALVFAYINDEDPVFAIGKQICPMLSVVMIIVVIYVVPSRRWSEYMHAWRKLDYCINSILSGCMQMNAVPETLKDIEESIASDLT